MIDVFHADTKSFTTENKLEVKVLLRRGKCHQSLEQFELAKRDLDSCLVLEPTNGEARNLLKKATEVIEQREF